IILAAGLTTTSADSIRAVIVNSATGQRVTPSVRTDGSQRGRFTVETLAPGGPYTIDVSAPGYASANASGLMLALGQRLTLTFRLEPATTLAPVTVTAARNPLLSASRTGP